MQGGQWISRAVEGVQLSAIKEMAILGAQAPDAVSLAWGLPSFRTPAHIRAAVAEALEDDPDIGKYALPGGLAELRQIVARHHQSATGLSVNPDSNVLITCGNMQGMSSLLRAILDPGDEVVMTDPGFASHIQQIRLLDGEPVYWALDEEQAWGLNLDLLPTLCNSRTKAIVLVTPANPTGTVFSEDDLLVLGEFALANRILILVDDPYSSLVYDDVAGFYNLASEARFADQLAYLFTFSKIHAMSGWRVGYMILPGWLRNEVLKVHDANIICTPRISQIAALAALGGDAAHVQEFRDVLAARRDLICERLDQVPQVFEYLRPDGAYYVFPRIVAEHEDSREFSMRLLADAGVAVTPGIAFGPHGEHHVRLAYCAEEDVINEAFDRIERLYPA